MAKEKITEPKKAPLETLVIDDAKYKTYLTRKYKNRKSYTPKNKKEITAFIPGTIKDILVKEGDLVNEGDTVLKLEAMKMVNNVVSAADGKIKKIWINMGERVTRDQLLIELE